jgi:hypothetical protein
MFGSVSKKGRSMTKDEPSWWAYAVVVIVIAGLFAAVPFWMHGLTISEAKIAAMVIFPIVVAAFAFAIWRESSN